MANLNNLLLHSKDITKVIFLLLLFLLIPIESKAIDLNSPTSYLTGSSLFPYIIEGKILINNSPSADFGFNITNLQNMQTAIITTDEYGDYIFDLVNLGMYTLGNTYRISIFKPNLIPDAYSFSITAKSGETIPTFNIASCKELDKHYTLTIRFRILDESGMDITQQYYENLKEEDYIELESLSVENSGACFMPVTELYINLYNPEGKYIETPFDIFSLQLPPLMPQEIYYLQINDTTSILSPLQERKYLSLVGKERRDIFGFEPQKLTNDGKWYFSINLSDRNEFIILDRNNNIVDPSEGFKVNKKVDAALLKELADSNRMQSYAIWAAIFLTLLTIITSSLSTQFKRRSLIIAALSKLSYIADNSEDYKLLFLQAIIENYYLPSTPSLLKIKIGQLFKKYIRLPKNDLNYFIKLNIILKKDLQINDKFRKLIDYISSQNLAFTPKIPQLLIAKIDSDFYINNLGEFLILNMRPIRRTFLLKKSLLDISEVIDMTNFKVGFVNQLDQTRAKLYLHISYLQILSNIILLDRNIATTYSVLKQFSSVRFFIIKNRADNRIKSLLTIVSRQKLEDTQIIWSLVERGYLFFRQKMDISKSIYHKYKGRLYKHIIN